MALTFIRKINKKGRFLLSSILLLLALKALSDGLLHLHQGNRYTNPSESESTLQFHDHHDKVHDDVQREQVYAAYHEARKERCDGCRYIPFYKRMYPNVKSVFDAGAANCGVMRLLEARGYETEGIEYSEWVVNNFCQDFLRDPKRIEVGPINSAMNKKVFDLVLCTDVLEHIPILDIPSTLETISSLARVGGDVFLVIASDPSKHENHPERSSAATELKQSGLKIHETVKPRSWWLLQLSKYGLVEDEKAMEVFMQTNQKEVHDPRYGYSIHNFKNRGDTKVYKPNRRHVDRVYCLKKISS